jgi:hypothetical protein
MMMMIMVIIFWFVFMEVLNIEEVGIMGLFYGG